jgi:hypothetical protein
MSNHTDNPPNNRAVLNIAQIIRNVMTLATDAEIEVLFINSRQAIPARYTMKEMGHRTATYTNPNRQHNVIGICPRKL